MDTVHCLHAYTGEGKGKTTCAVGLCVRHAGCGGRVLFTQFLKGNNSGEIAPLSAMPGVTVLLGQPVKKFVFAMNAQERAEEAAAQKAHLLRIDEAVRALRPTLVVCDELLAAIEVGFIDAGSAEECIRRWLESSEVVVTGRKAPQNIADLAGYATEMRKIKHPYDSGISARRGVEF